MSHPKVYLVGGAVRDKLLGRKVHDADYVVVGSSPEYMLAQGFSQVGADFPVFLHPQTHHEYALARTERKSGNKHTDFVVHSSPDVTLEDDLIRRDLTINAMAIEVKGLFDSHEKTGEIIDPYNGLSDIKQGIIRHVSPAFSEDPLRILRVARFYGRFYPLGFKIAEETLELIKIMVTNGDLQHLSRERIWIETQRATMGDYPQIYWQTLYKIGALDLFYPLQIAWENNKVQQIISKSLALSAQFKLNMEQRWAILMASFDPILQQEDLTVNDWLENITQIAQQNCIPKKIMNFSKIYAQNATDLENIENLYPNELMALLQNINAHKQAEQIDNLLIIPQIINMAKASILLNKSRKSYQAISIQDIDNSLKGQDIGIALDKKRVEHLTTSLASYL
ncbi:MAG: tRNA nucleotidyltransferase [Moraxellaceae bacterium]|nr:tRNA nucleotidyltransferase [Moraxellaceae bacterium]